jgi:hypothetical protein
MLLGTDFAPASVTVQKNCAEVMLLDASVSENVVVAAVGEVRAMLGSPV